MDLRQYLSERDLTLATFGDAIGVSRVAVSRYVRGLRMPSPAVMRAIMDATEGEVTPNDFYQSAVADAA